MKHVIIGTAGHVDHGKTLLVKALTGIDTDRLQEEKKRGITIELGFAHLDWPDGTQAGIVDVPGHEKFIKNMLAGAGGVDLCMLVVAADEGFMPQTVEHLDILDLLGIRDGLVVITKCDMVDDEWLEMMREEVAERVRGTFLAGKPVVPVSAYTGEGVPELSALLHDMVQRAAEKSLRTPFRLPVDRVFSVEGFGTVVTGTLIEGCMREGETAELVPSGAAARIRNLQVHGRDVEAAFAGQRVAVNLAGLKRSDIKRGDAVARPGTVRVSRLLDVRLRDLPGSGRTIQNGSQLHFYHGSAVQLARVSLLDAERLEPGQSGYAQLSLEEPVATKPGDRFVVRFYSPLETIGGGVVLDDAPARHRRGQPGLIEALRIKESGSVGDRVAQAVSEFGAALPDAAQLAARLELEREALAAELESLAATGRLAEPLPGRYIAAPVLDGLWADCRGILADYHAKNPLHAGMKTAELRQKLCKGAGRAEADAILDELAREGRVRRVGERYALADFEVRLTKKQRALRERLLEAYRRAGVETPTVDEALEAFAPNERAEARQVLESVLTEGELVMLSPQLCLHRTAWERAAGAVRAHFEKSEAITLAELRDELGTSRKYALAILEYLDRLRVTKKEGDLRRLDRGFDA